MSTDLVLSLFILVIREHWETLNITKRRRTCTVQHTQWGYVLYKVSFILFYWFQRIKEHFHFGSLEKRKRRKKAHAVVAEFYFIPHSLVFSQGEWTSTLATHHVHILDTYSQHTEFKKEKKYMKELSFAYMFYANMYIKILSGKKGRC